MGVTISPNVTTHSVKEGTKVELNCSASHGNPTPSIKWSSDSISDTFVGSVVTFNSVNRRDSKRYTCTANNSIGIITKVISLNVQCKCHFCVLCFHWWLPVAALRVTRQQTASFTAR